MINKLTLEYFDQICNKYGGFSLEKTLNYFKKNYSIVAYDLDPPKIYSSNGFFFKATIV